MCAKPEFKPQGSAFYNTLTFLQNDVCRNKMVLLKSSGLFLLFLLCGLNTEAELTLTKQQLLNCVHIGNLD